MVKATHKNMPKKSWIRPLTLLLIAIAMFVYASNPINRTYWPYMLTAYWLGIFVYIGELKRIPAGKNPSLLNYLFPKEVWLDRSSLNDCVLVLLNFALIYVVQQYISVGPNNFQAWTSSVLNELHGGDVNISSHPSVLVIALYTIAAFLLSELFFYINHRLQHTVPALWEFHKVHHSAKVLTPLTVSRVHPAVIFFDVIARNLGRGIPSGIFLFLYPEVRSVNIVATTIFCFSALNVLGGNLHHSHIWLRFPSYIERFITSPALHQIHHSDKVKHYDKNFGTILTFWDWVFGSLYIPKEKENISFGLGNSRESENYQSIRGLYFYPLKQTIRRIRRIKSTSSPFSP